MNRAAMKALAKNMTDSRYHPIMKGWPCSFALRQSIIINGSTRLVYSVLGIMADIYIRATKGAKWEESGELGKPDKLITKADDYIESMNMEAWRLDLPREILEWYGISRDEAAELWVQQSRGYSMEQLSKSILRGIE